MRLNIFSTKKILLVTCCLLFIGLLTGAVVAFGQTPTSAETLQANSAPTTTSPPQLNISLIYPEQQTVEVGTQTFVIFNVKSNSGAVPGVNVTLSGSATGKGITDWQGNATIAINATEVGTITATASATNYTNGSMTLAAAKIGGDPTGFWIIVIVALGIAIILAVYAISHLRQKKTEESANKKSDTKEPGITESAMISLSLLLISLVDWIWGGFLGKNYIIGILGAGVFGGIILDIIVNKGEYIVPKAEEDGYSLGVIYGAVMGFITAIVIIGNEFNHGNIAGTPYDPILAFLGAVGVKNGTEFATTQKLMPPKKKSSISFNLKDGQGNFIEEGITYAPMDATNFKIEGEILISEKINERQAMHLNFQKENNILIVKDTSTNDKNPTKFENIDVSGINLDKGKWEAWASWDGDDKYDQAESIHRKFELVESTVADAPPTDAKSANAASRKGKGA